MVVSLFVVVVVAVLQVLVILLAAGFFVFYGRSRAITCISVHAPEVVVHQIACFFGEVGLDACK